jgi:hypothetical protein
MASRTHFVTRLVLATMAAVLLVGALSGSAWAQTNPTARTLPYSQNWGTATFSTMPAGTAAWNGLNGGSITTQALAESSTPGGDATLNPGTFNCTGSATGGSYSYVASSNTRYGVLTSSNATNGANQLALAINTTGKTGINVYYDVEIICANPRTVGVVMQYRVGHSGAWTTISGTGNPYSQAGGTTGVKASPVLTLPSACDNQAEVQLRWATWRGTETGNSSAVAIDNVTIGYTFPSVAANLIGRWRMEEGSGTAILDASGKGYDGATTGSPTWVGGAEGTYALSLNGTSQYASVPDNTTLRIGTNRITLAAWVKPTQNATAGLVSKAIQGGTSGYELKLSSSQLPFVRFNQASGSYRLDAKTTSTYPIDGNTWMHVAATYDGATIKIYENGVLDNSASATFTIQPNTTMPLTIGVKWDGSGTPADYLKGTIDDVRVYDQALSAGEIAAIAGLPTYTIAASADANGSISPSGTVYVAANGTQSFSIAGNTGYHVADVLVDGISQGPQSGYTFSSVNANHTISASFAVNTSTHTILASAGTGGTIDPVGTVAVGDGANQAFAITANSCYTIASVVVDGSSVGAVAGYTFTSVTTDHTITANFAAKAPFTITATSHRPVPCR